MEYAIEFATSFSCAYVILYYSCFIILGKKLNITVIREDGTKGVATIIFRPLGEIHRILLRVRIKRILSKANKAKPSN